MCNPCGFQCCASDEFGGCGCEHCDHPDCYDLDAEEDGAGLEENDPIYFSPALAAALAW